MNLPSWEDFTVPVLIALREGDLLPIRQIRQRVADNVGLSNEQRKITLSSGQLAHENRITWAVSYLNRVDALERPQRGHYRITEKGRQLLSDHPERISEAVLREVANLDDQWWTAKRGTGTIEDTAREFEETSTSLDPTEQVEQGIARIQEDVAHGLLSRLQGREPEFFERAVVELLLKWGTVVHTDEEV